MEETELEKNRNGICDIFDVTLSICDVTLKSVTLLMYQRYREEIGIGRFCDDLTQFSILPF